MLKMIVLVLVAGTIVGVWSGALELTWHQDKVAEIPSKIIDFTGNSPVIEQARVAVVGWKRQGEQYITKDDKQKVQLAIGYVNTDTAQLQKEIVNGRDPVFLTYQAQLLADSIRTMQGNISKASDTTLAAIKSDAIKTIGEAQGALAQLQSIKTDQVAFKTTTESLATLLGQSTVGQVAGAEDRKQSVASPSPSVKK